MLTHPSQKDLVFLRELLETGKVVPVIDRSYPLGDVAEAIRYLQQGHAEEKSSSLWYTIKNLTTPRSSHFYKTQLCNL